MENDIDEIGEAAIDTVEQFIIEHGAAAIPALVGASVMWTVQHGAPDLMRNTLTSSLELVDTMEVAVAQAAN